MATQTDLGSGYAEVVRNAEGRIVGLHIIPGDVMKLSQGEQWVQILNHEIVNTFSTHEIVRVAAP